MMKMTIVIMIPMIDEIYIINVDNYCLSPKNILCDNMSKKTNILLKQLVLIRIIL